MALGMFGGVRHADAVDVAINTRKFIAVDKIASTGTAKVVFVSAAAPLFPMAPVTDPSQIEATIDVAYDGVRGTFLMPQGSNWLVKSPTLTKYENISAPTGGSVKLGIINTGTTGKGFKVVAKSLGETPLDISSAPSGFVYQMLTVVNAGDETRYCTLYPDCTHRVVAGGTGYKLKCGALGSSGDPDCKAAPPASTTVTTTVTSTTVTTTTIP